jgi:signal transduction histidine kinase
LIDLLVGVVLTGLGVVMTLSPSSHDGLVATLTFPLVTLPVVWRRRAPLACVSVFLAGVVLTAIPTFHQVRCGVAIPAGLLLLYSLASGSNRHRALGGLVLALSGMVVLALTDPKVDAGFLVALIPLSVGVWGAGRLVAARGRVAALLSQRSRALERQREQTATLAVDVERTQLASDLDASAGRRLGEMIELTQRGEAAVANPQKVRTLFAQIEQAGRASLDEMRGLLGVLRDHGPPSLSPHPTLAELERLLAEARAGGRVVELEIEGERRPLPGGVELAGYRIVQHSIDALDDSRDTPMSVCLRYAPDALELEITGAEHDTSGRTEEALLAARERVAAHGGSFSIRAAGPGRSAVRARLPVSVAYA